MKKSFLGLGAFLIACFVTAQVPQGKGNGNTGKETKTATAPTKEESNIIKTGDKAPSITVKSDKNPVMPQELKGKVVLVNLFATWCGPCQTELAEIEKTLWPEFKDNKQFRMLTIGREHDDSELAKYNKKKGFSFPLYPDKDRSIYNQFAKSYIPRTYLIGKNGKVVYTSVGFNEEEFKQLMTKIREELKK